MRTPKAPAGFVALESEEAKAIPDNALVHAVYAFHGLWHVCKAGPMSEFRALAPHNPHYHYHVQLPPKVEWEEVWTYRFDEDELAFLLYRNGLLCGKMFATPVGQDMDTIVRALNEMEGQ